MSSPDELRSAIESATSASRDSEYAEHGSASLRFAFNSVAPDHLRFSEAALTALEVVPSRASLTSRETSMLVERVGRAVAAIGKEIRYPAERYSQLTAADYGQAPVYVEVQGRTVLFRPRRPGSVMQQLPVASLSSQAMDRLTNLLPERPEAEPNLHELSAARVPSRRAIREVAEAAYRLNGLSLSFHQDHEIVDASMTRDQADEIRSELDQDDVDVELVRRRGVLDGARSKRRLFYLETNTAPIEGVIDERLVKVVVGNLMREVDVTLERTVRLSRAGVQGRPAYRLIDLDFPDEPLKLPKG